MCGTAGWTGLVVVALAALAEEPGQGLPPRVQTSPPPQVRPEAELAPPPRLQADVPGKPEKMEGLQRETDRLRKEREALQVERGKTDQQTQESGSALESETTRLRLRLTELLLKMATREPAARAPEPPALKPVPKSSEPPPAGEPKAGAEPRPAEMPRAVDPHALAASLYRAGDFEAALGTYRILEAGNLERVEQIFVQYMIGSCLVQLGKLDDAVAAWREVASAREDPFLASAAQWQIGGVRWRRDLEQQLQQLRQRREAVEGKR